MQQVFLAGNRLSFIILLGIFWANTFFSSIFIAYSESELYGRGSARVSLHLLDFCGVLFRAQLSLSLHAEVHPVGGERKHALRRRQSLWHQLIATLLASGGSPALPFPIFPPKATFPNSFPAHQKQQLLVATSYTQT